MPDVGPDWRVLDGAMTAWFDAPSLIESAALAGRTVELSPGAAVDVRATGVRVRLDSAADARAVSGAARELGLLANSGVLQHLGVVIESADPAAVRPFWQRVLDYAITDDRSLEDPMRRDPAVRFRRSTERRPLRNRIHLDVVRPAPAVEQAALGEASGPYGVCHADPDGNEVDLVPGDSLGDGTATADWQAVFGAVACYRTTSTTQQRDLAAAVASSAHEVGFPMLIDLRPGLVVVDSGKDQWERDAHGLDVDFAALAATIQRTARELGAVATPASARFVQLFFDAADVEEVRSFWIAALDDVADPRDGVTDIYDPRRLDPVLVFQPLDVSDTERRAQRNRIHLELAVPPDRAPARLATALAAGGRLLDESEQRWRVVDPEGNELVITSEG